MTFISDEREAELFHRRHRAAQKLDTALLLDIGSGNTKGGYRNGDKGYVTVAVPYGSVTIHTEAVKKRAGKGDFAEAAAVTRQEVPLSRSEEGHRGQAGPLEKGSCLPERRAPSGRWRQLSVPATATVSSPSLPRDIETYHRKLIEAKGEFPPR